MLIQGTSITIMYKRIEGIKKGYSIPKFSELTGIHRRTIEDIEKRGDCKISIAYKFAQTLGVTLDELYDEKTPED